ncbi:unnamed protein product (macronuclear) [Paramecium tetraurelia]|uniref:Uncharacterized protein n=1 Tax=Paramecium tetraurelia TaxID=5888 RepID=A0EDG4_PARTE|nr:uncharacterized protein GSPATT00004200001 [Paramecium tetraurelia]CAK93331.1 unnamed protein product [Paramecium tetraurelia]|eukprot:XP_001460728.1 hypothetical protein (macronuclear) [Paramecium tetraurelia strain d4-2]
MRGFFAITRAFVAPIAKSTFKFSSQQQKIQMRIVLNQINQIIRLSSTMSGLRIANQYDLSLFSLLEEAKGNLFIYYQNQDDSVEVDIRQIGLHLGCSITP